jgi:hypothetical protein
MNILCFLSHPAQFLFFRNTILNLRRSGHTVFILIKTKDILSSLLDEAGMDYINILPTPRGNSKFAILSSLIYRDEKIYQFARKRKISLMMGSDASLAHVSRFLGIPCITTTEDDYPVIRPLARLTYPFTTHILVPIVCDTGRWYSKKTGYNSYMKLAYLHPHYFIPDRSKVNIPTDKPYYLIRRSGLHAYHDYGIKGLNKDTLSKIISFLSEMGKVFISLERGSKSFFPDHQLNIPVSDIRHYLYFADLLISDSQSMSMEASVLGTPNIRVSDFAGRISVLEELEHKYHLTFGVKPAQQDKVLQMTRDILNMPDRKEIFRERRQKMLSDKIDVTAFLTWFIENYPSSFEIMKRDPGYQGRFK